MRRYLSLRWRRLKRHLRSCADGPVVNRMPRHAFATPKVAQRPSAEGFGDTAMPVRDQRFISKTTDLKLHTVYSPPNYPDGTVHKTKAEEAEHHS